jgi:hypothetical protein
MYKIKFNLFSCWLNITKPVVKLTN